MRRTSNTNLSELAEQGTNVLRDIKPPVHIPSGWEWAWWILAFVLLAAIIWLGWHYWRARRNVAPPVIVIPPHVQARKRLEEALALLHSPKEFCIAVSDTLRWYLEQRFDFRAPERTTEEFLRELGDTPVLSPAQKTALADFLERCDLVKFAKYQPREPELRDLHAAALRMVDDTTASWEAAVAPVPGLPPLSQAPSAASSQPPVA